MTNPEVQEVLNDVRACWNDLSPLQLGEKLNVLIGFKCSRRGIAKELGKPARTIDRYIALVNPPKEGSDWATMLERTLPKKPQKQSSISACEADRRIPSKIPAKKGVGPVIKEKYPAQDHAHISTAQQTKKMTSPLSIMAQEPPVVNGAMGGQENPAGEDTSKMSLVDQFNLSRGPITPDKIQRLAAMSKQMERRPFRDARSMKRQGKPLPPIDPHGPVS